MEDLPNADIATHPFLLAKWDESIRLSARFINADKDEVTNAYRPAITANLILYNMMEWSEGDNVVITDLSYPSHSLYPAGPAAALRHRDPGRAQRRR